MKASNDKTAKKPRRARKLSAHVTHLEMAHHHPQHLPIPTRPTIALMRAQNIPADFYRFLYEMVGKPYHWQDRRDLSDSELLSIINGDDAEIHVLYADGCPAGFFELDKSNMPDSIEILYFGLGSNFQGLGIGKWFLYAAISAAWTAKPEKLCVETNTLDHPAALPLYQRLGFSPVRVSDVKIVPWL